MKEQTWPEVHERCSRRADEKYQEDERYCRLTLHTELSDLTNGAFQLCNNSGDLPRQALPPCDSVQLSPPALAGLRLRVLEAATKVGMTKEHCHDLAIAASEAAMNAIVHGNEGVGRIGITSAGCVQVWIRDSGKGIPQEHLRDIALTPDLSAAGTLGEGFEMMQIVDRLWLLTGPSGTTVVLEQA